MTNILWTPKNGFDNKSRYTPGLVFMLMDAREMPLNALIHEYSQLYRIVGKASMGARLNIYCGKFTIGVHHKNFFSNKIIYLVNRGNSLYNELVNVRGFDKDNLPPKLDEDILDKIEDKELLNDWSPSEEDICMVDGHLKATYDIADRISYAERLLKAFYKRLPTEMEYNRHLRRWIKNDRKLDVYYYKHNKEAIFRGGIEVGKELGKMDVIRWVKDTYKKEDKKWMARNK